jgi:hypothetical protein
LVGWSHLRLAPITLLPILFARLVEGLEPPLFRTLMVLELSQLRCGQRSYIRFPTRVLLGELGLSDGNRLGVFFLGPEQCA